jgi:hypothetical protein
MAKKTTTKWEEKMLAERRFFENTYFQIRKLEQFPNKKEALVLLETIIEAVKKLQRIEG